MTTAQDPYRIITVDLAERIKRGTLLAAKVSREARCIAYRWDHLPRELRIRLAAEIERALPERWAR